MLNMPFLAMQNQSIETLNYFFYFFPAKSMELQIIQFNIKRASHPLAFFPMHLSEEIFHETPVDHMVIFLANEYLPSIQIFIQKFLVRKTRVEKQCILKTFYQYFYILLCIIVLFPPLCSTNFPKNNTKDFRKA